MPPSARARGDSEGGHLRLTIPERLAAACRDAPERGAWLERLPHTVAELCERWSLSLEAPFDGDEVSCAWVAPSLRGDGTRAVLKLGMPHMEGAHEIHGLRFWAGDGTARLLEADEDCGALLLERCEPGTALRRRPEPEQDIVIAGLLRRLWRPPPAASPFRRLSAMTTHWSEAVVADERRPDAGLVREGLRLFAELPRPSPDDVLLATDLHAGNVLAARREPWLAIDPKPFVGDRAYDATQHLLNCEARLHADPGGTIRRFADLLEVDRERVRLWLLARAATASRDSWRELAPALAKS